jgi:excisionase family DNA binding protein
VTEGRLVVTVTEAAELLGISRGLAYELARVGQLPSLRLGRRLLVPPRRPRGVAGTSGSARELDVQKGAVLTSARFYHLSEMVLEAADYLADHDHPTTERLNEVGALLAEIGRREAASEGCKQPAPWPAMRRKGDARPKR